VELDLAAVQHLLRHLNDLPNLRRNPLVAALFQRADSADHDIQARIREIVKGALDLTLSRQGDGYSQRASRWRTIVQQCDLDGRRREVVAAELGLSQRQFYRERTAAHKSLATHIVRELTRIVQSHSALASVASKADLQIELADALRRVGSFDDAGRVLNQLADAPIERAARLTAINDLLDLDLEQHRRDDAVRLIAMGRSIGSEIDDRDTAAGAELIAIEAANAWVSGATLEYVGYTKELLLHAARARRTRRSCELGLRASLALVRIFLHSSDAAEVRRLLTAAKSFIEADPTAPAVFSLDLLLAVGEESLLAGAFDKAIAAFAESLAIARKERAPYYTACASSSLASAYCLLGNADLVEAHAENALTLSEDRNWLLPTTTARLALSHISLERNDPHRSLMLSKQLRNGLSNGFLYIVDEMTADALARLGDFHGALAFTDRARDGLEKYGLLRHLGVTERIRAEVYIGLRQPKAARDAIVRSVELLERFGTMPALARAYELSARLTNNTAHGARAHELKQLVRVRRGIPDSAEDDASYAHVRAQGIARTLEVST
jgi:tetratricopeptide (TPR) repeat protein